MDKILLNYIIQAILGGASGYITNDYAINMLFKEYTPLKIGGVIKKTRHEFIENISNMVENDIINKDKLQEILSDDSFIKEFENLTADFYKNSLYEEVGTFTFGNIDGFDQSIKTIDILTAKIIDEHMPNLFNLIADSINLNDFFNITQLNKISSSLYDSLNTLIDNNIFENFILSIIKSNDKSVLNNIINKESYTTVISNAINIFLNALSESDNEKIVELMTSIGMGNAFNSSKEILGNKKLKKVINFDSDVLNSINESFLNYINSDKGVNLVNSLLNSLFSYGKKSNKSIFQLLDTSFEENLKLYLINIIPSVTENVVAWVNLNSYLIDDLIEQSVDEVIKESDGIKAKLLSLIKNSYFKNLSKKYSIANKIISYIENTAEPEKLSKNLSDKLIEILSNLTIKEIMLEAENNNITPESIGDFVVNYTNKNTDTIIKSIVDYISEIEINKLLPKDLINDRLKFSIINKLKELAHSKIIKNYLTQKSNEFAELILSKELGELVDEEKAKIIANKTKDFVLNQIRLNENLITAWIIKEAQSIVKTSSIKLHPDLINGLNKELYKNFEKSSNELINVKLSTALDKLNSIDNLSSNSSESIRSFATKNTDIIIGGSIKAIATDNLNKLNDDELVDLANDFIGRELKPIMYFGGILGVFAGLILATFQNPTLDPAKFNVVNMLVYSFVGYVTNVIAINMIFKPYKEIKLLSKIPFLRNFSLGYIIKNQRTFAKNTAHFIDNSLLSKKSINELFNKYYDKIKISFTKSIAENDYKTINTLLNNNKHSIVKGVYLFLKTKAKENVNKISFYFYNKISSIKISSLMNDKVKSKFNSSMTEAFLSPKIYKKAHSLINSDVAIKSLFTEKIVKKYLNSITASYLNKTSLMLNNEDKFNNFILNYEDKYSDYINKSMDEILDIENKDKLAKSVAGKLNNIIFSKELRGLISNKTISLVNKLVDRNKSFGEIFNGKFKDYVDSQAPKLLTSLSVAIINNIKESKLKISLMIQSEIKNQLGFIEKSMYTLMGGDEIVNELLSKIILVKIPKFLDDKKLELNSILNILLEQKLYKAKVELLYTGINKLQLDNVIDSYLNSDNSLKIENKINTIISDLFTILEDAKLSSILNLFYADELNMLLNTYNKEISTFTSELKLNINNNKSQIIEKLSTFTDSLADRFLQSRLKDAFAGISENDIKYAQEKIYEELSKNGLEDTVNSTLNEIKNNFNANTSEFIDRDEFIRTIEKYMVDLIDNSEFEEVVTNHFEAVIDEIITTNFSFIDNETKKYLLNVFVESCISSLKRNLNEILKSIEFDKIAQEEIEKMEPEKIHDLFDSFAGKYFKKLMLYGFGGFIFGVNLYVGFSLTLLKIISELFNKGPRK